MKADRKKLSADTNTNPIQLKSEKLLARTTFTLIILSVFSVITYLSPYIALVLDHFIKNGNGVIYSFTSKKIRNILILTNSAFTFFVYYLNSIKFRENFNDLLDTKISTPNIKMPILGNRNHRE